MLAAWTPDAANRAGAIAAALSPADVETETILTHAGRRHLASGPAARGIAQPPAPAFAQGLLFAVDGWIDEVDGQEVGDSFTQSSYACRLAARADRAEIGMVGQFASMCWEPDGTLRLARSPWRAPPLHYAITQSGPAAASVLRVLFALGVERRIDRDRLVHALYFDGARNTANDWFEGIRQVPLGSVVRISPSGNTQIDRWYDPQAIRPNASGDPRDWITEARNLLNRSAKHTVRRSSSPSISLSAGLDSSLAASAMVKQGARPMALTLAPDESWSGLDRPASFSNEVDAAAAFASQLGLPHRIVRMQSWDQGLLEFYRATDIATPFIGNAPAQIAIAQAARNEGCDWLFDATIGNDTLSARGDWAYSEYLLRGKWRELHKALAARPDDNRGTLRKLAALAIAPLLPASLGSRIRARLTRSAEFYRHASLLKPQVIRDLGLDNLRARYGRQDPPGIVGRHALIDFAWGAGDAGQADFDLGLEQISGVCRRDALSYQPLIEFSLSLPSEAFLRNGIDRWVARELARGELPESQRTNPRMGAHHVDRYLRLGRARDELAQWADRLHDHPVLGELVDTERLLEIFRDWPESEPADAATRHLLIHGVPNVLALGRYVAHIENRNDL